MIRSRQPSNPKRRNRLRFLAYLPGQPPSPPWEPTGENLRYRGYDIHDLAKYATFEEVACLLIHEHLPNRYILDRYKEKLMTMRGLPAPVKSTLEQIPAAAHPMDVLRTGCSVLGTVLPEHDDHNLAEARNIADRLLSHFLPC